MGEWSGRVQYRSKISWFLYFKWQRQSYWVLDSFGLQRYSLAWNGWYPHPLCYSSQWIWIFITPRKSSFRRPIFCSGTLELIDQSRLSFLLSKSLAGSPLSTWNIGQKHCKVTFNNHFGKKAYLFNQLQRFKNIGIDFEFENKAVIFV